MEKIDFVVLWVDSSDKSWSEKKAKYAGLLNKSVNKEMSSEKAFRDYGLFKYWFRGVEKFAPWVNHVYLITDDQKPEWLNPDVANFTLVDHKDFLDEHNLPVFNTNAIEVNVHRIKGLANNFVLFNDDQYLTAPTLPEDFFYDNKPKDTKALFPVKPEKNGTANFQINNMSIVNSYFTKQDIIKSGGLFSTKYGADNIRSLLQLPLKFIPGFYDPHCPVSYQKSTFEKVWNRENKILKQTSSNRFRAQSDVSDWLFRYWQLAEGNIVPRSRKFSKFVALDSNSIDEICNYITAQQYKELCINDGFDVADFENKMQQIDLAFEKILPDKSAYEL